MSAMNFTKKNVDVYDFLLYNIIIERIKKMNNFKEFYENNQSLLTEMARLDNNIEVRNDGDSQKFSHFHWKGVHFDLLEDIPQTISDLKERIHFKKEKNKLSDKELGVLLDILKGKSSLKRGKIYPNVYEFIKAVWEILNERDVDK